MRDRIPDVWGELGLTTFLIFFFFLNSMVWAWEVHGQENRLIQVSFECADSRSFFTILFSVDYLPLLTVMISPQLYSSSIRQGHGLHRWPLAGNMVQTC